MEKLIRKIKVIGRLKTNQMNSGSQIKYYDAERGNEMAEVQALGIAISIDDGILYGKMTWINFGAMEQAATSEVIEVIEDVEIVEIDIKTEP